MFFTSNINRKTGRIEMWELGKYRPNSQIKTLIPQINFSLKVARVVSFLLKLQ